MRRDEMTGWLARHQRRRDALIHLTQPMTASQLAPQLETTQARCSRVLRGLTQHGLTRCLNPGARRGRVYGLTPEGEHHQQHLRSDQGLGSVKYSAPDIDWGLYGWVCFSHRSAILRAMDRPLQPATIKRIARHQNEELRMSANNVRDVIRLFVAQSIAKAVQENRYTHPRYELTERGRAFQAVLLGAETRTLPVEDEHGVA